MRCKSTFKRRRTAALASREARFAAPTVFVYRARRALRACGGSVRPQLCRNTEKFLLSKNGETAPIVYSNAELTAVDLVHWAKKIGSLSVVATVLAELHEVTNFTGAAEGVYRTTDVSDVQRLGYLYEVVLGDCEQGAVVYDELKKLSPNLRNVLLVPGGNKECVRRDSRWHIDVNEEIEVDDL